MGARCENKASLSGDEGSAIFIKPAAKGKGKRFPLQFNIAVTHQL
jgi:hypothetical protein